MNAKDWLIIDETRRVPAVPLYLGGQGWSRSAANALRFTTQVDAANWIADLRAQGSPLLHNRTVGTTAADKPPEMPPTGTGIAESDHDPFGLGNG